MGCAGQQQMATLGYSPLPPNLVQADFDAIGRLNGGVEPPKVSAATCKNPYVDGQIPLPGEPPVPGQTCPPQGCGVNVATPGSAGSGGSTGGSTGGGPGGTTGNKGAGSGAAGSGGSTKGLTAAQVAAGYRVVNGHIVKSIDAGPSKYVRADALISASKGIDGIPVPELLIWVLVAVLLFLGIPLLGSYRKRHSGDERDPSESRSEAAR